MRRQHQVEGARKRFSFDIQADEPKITQAQLLRLSLCDSNGGRRAIDADQIRVREKAGIQGRQDTQATTKIENVLSLAEVSHRVQPDCFIIFIPLAIENRKDRWLRGKIIERYVIDTIARAFSFGVDVELVQFFDGELLSLP